MNREFLQQAQTYEPGKHQITGRYVSEKLDGQRFFWDACTRGLPILEIPWANTEKSNAVPISTGLWSRYGNPIVPPDWWLDELPDFMVEGELFLGRGMFQPLRKIVSRTVNLLEDDWMDVKAIVLDSPHPEQVFMDGRINNTQYRKVFKDIKFGKAVFPPTTVFQTRLNWLRTNLPINGILQLHQQMQLPFSATQAETELSRFFDHVLEQGGEGLVIKNANDVWHPKRVKSVLKWKPWHDMEAEIIGYKWGEETDKGSKLLGMMGSIRCQVKEPQTIADLEIKPGIFNVSGFTNEERVMVRDDPDAEINHGKPVVGYHNPLFPIGQILTIKFREVTDDGLPREARHWRKYENA